MAGHHARKVAHHKAKVKKTHVKKAHKPVVHHKKKP